MNNGFYGFPNILGLLRATAFRAVGKPGAQAGAELAGGTTSGAPTSGEHVKGELVVDHTGTLWICTAAGTPGTWTQVVGGSGSYTLPDATTTTIGGLEVDETPASGHPVALSTIRYQMPWGVAALGGDGLVRSLSQQTGADAGITEGGRWTRAAAAILTATASWEGTAVEEPSVLFDAGTWKMWYAGGWSPRAGIGYATCPGTSDPTVAGNWTKYVSNPVISGTAQQPTVLKQNGTFYAFYADSALNLLTASSADGLTWGTATVALATGGGVAQWANSAVWVENGTQWKMLVEGHTSGVWMIYLATSPDGLTWTLGNGGSPLSTLQVHSGGAYGGPCVPNPPRFNGRYELWYHAVNNSIGLPSDIYRASSTDLLTWTRYASNPVLTRTGSGFEIDQVADPEIAEVYGSSYLFYDGDDNTVGTASIGVASFGGPLATLVGQAALPAPLDSSGTVPVADLPTATSSTLGVVKPDNSTVTISAGVLSASTGSGSPLTTTGDLYGYSTTNSRVPVGADGLALVADSTQSLGVRWGAPQPSSLLVLLPNPYAFVESSATDHGQPPDFITLASGDVVGVGGM